MQALKVKDARFKYQGSEQFALNGLSLDVQQGEFVSLLGRNGSGKSTVCMLANGLIPHVIRGTFEGSVEVFGMDVTKKSVAEISTRVGIVFQEPESQLFCMSVEEEVAFGPENLAVPREQIRERVEWALDLVGMRGYNKRSPFSLSGGQKQRVAIAAALSMLPDMLVLDEPAYALDPLGRLELYSVLRRLREKHGMTVVLVERDTEEAALFSDRVALMSEGKIVDVGPPQAVLRDPARLRAIGLSPPQMAELASLLSYKSTGKEFSFLGVEDAQAAVRHFIESQSGRARA